MKQPRTAVFLHPSFGLGGAERLVLDSAHALVAAGWKVQLHTPETRPSAHVVPDLETFDLVRWNTGIPETLLGRFRGVLAVLRMRKVNRRLAARVPPDLCIVDAVPHAIPHLKRCVPGVPVLCYCHFPEAAEPSRHTAPMKRFHRRRIDRLELDGLAAADRILVNSAFTERELRRISGGRDLPPLRVVPPAVDIPGVPCDPGAGFRVLCVGRMHPFKRLGTALKAFALSGLRERFRLTLAGGLDASDPLVRREWGRLQELGAQLDLGNAVEWVPNPDAATLERLWGETAFFLHAASGEHFGIALAEAMARGLPCIAVGNGGPAGLIEDGRSGRLCGESAESLAEGLREAVAHPERAPGWGREARSRAVKLLGRERFQRELVEAGEACLGGEGRG